MVSEKGRVTHNEPNLWNKLAIDSPLAPFTNMV